MDISNASIGSRIRKIREERGYTLEQLAEYAEISATFLWEIEVGRKSMKVQNLAKIAAALDVPTDYFVYGKSPYIENVKINSTLTSLSEEMQQQVEKMITLFLDTVRISAKESSESDISEQE